MSSTHPLSSSSSEPKKKFGKNLNKLTKPPPPSVSLSTVSSSRAGIAGSALSSRNGLHLLSTKRSNSLVTSSSSSGGGLLGAKPKLSSSSSFGQSSSTKAAPRPLNTPSLRSESSYDVPLSSTGVSGGSSGVSGWGNANTNDIGSNTPTQPAWGLGEKPPQQTTLPSTTLAPKGRVSAGYHASVVTSTSMNINQANISSYQRVDPVESTNMYNEKTSNRRHVNAKSFDSDEQFSISRNKTSLNDVITTNRSSDPAISSTRENNVNVYSKDKALQQVEKKPSKHNLTPGNEIISSDNREQSRPDDKRIGLSIEEAGSGSNIKKPASFSSFENPTSSSTEVDVAKAATVGDQAEYMKRRARERAEERRAEEEARMNEQKERAARRLKELEDKMSNGQNDACNFDESKIERKNDKGNWRSNHSKSARTGTGYGNNQSSEIILERLGCPNESKMTSTGMKNTTEQNLASNSSSRKLFDPTRSYSSLVGGGPSYKSAQNSRPFRQRTPSPPPVLQISLHNSSKDQFFPHPSGRDIVDNSSPPVPMIQLTSYEDRDRGQRSMSSGPRMLFDPKSGSMIHAPSIDKRHSHHYSDDNVQGGKGRKDRTKQKSRGRDRERDGKIDSGLNTSFSRRPDANGSMQLDDSVRRRKQSDELDESSDLKGIRRNRKKEEMNGQRKDRKRTDKESKYRATSNEQSEMNYTRSIGISENGNNSSQATSKRYGNRNTHSRQSNGNEVVKMPRTRGVLYKVDESGNYVCADGCEADQGYGAHSVPGGRIRNPSAHAQFIGRNQRLQRASAETSSKMKDYEHNMGERQYQHKGFTKALSNGNYSQTQPLSGKQMSNHFDLSSSEEYSYHRYDGTNASSGTVAHGKSQQNRFTLSNSISCKDDKMKQNHSDQGIKNYELPAQLRVKANEPLSILSGVPDSPELQATAHPWAPSEAALAAAAANTTAQMGSLHSHKSEDSESSHNVTAEMMKIIDESVDDLNESDVDSSSSFVGLGFDPTENMDSMMMSPTIDSAVINNDTANMEKLSLDPTEGKSNNNLFAPLGTPNRFLGSSTWGTSGSLARSPGLSMGSLNWDMLGGGSNDPMPKMQQGAGISGQQHLNSPSTFLSLPLPVNQDGDTWGAASFGGGILGGVQIRNEQASNNGSNVNE